jgi:hypothetical protein
MNDLDQPAPKGRGGKRAGSGRKPGSTKVFTAFKLERSTVELLHELVPLGKRAAFVEETLLRALKRRGKVIKV